MVTSLKKFSGCGVTICVSVGMGNPLTDAITKKK
jgi:hypothetical protein